MKLDRTFRVVVLPAPVPPETMMFALPRTQASRKSATSRLTRAERDEVLDHVRIGGELADRQGGAVDGQRRDDRVDARAVGQAGVHHGRGLVHAAPDAAHDLVDRAAQVGVVLEGGVDLLDLAEALDVDRVVAVDHDLRDLCITQEGLQRAVAEDLVGDLLGQGCPLGSRQGRLIACKHVVEDDPYPLAEVGLRSAVSGTTAARATPPAPHGPTS